MSSGGAVHHIDANVTTIEVGDSPSSAGDGELWESFKFLIHGFKDLSTTSTIQSPEFTFNGHRWCMVVYPGGDDRARPGYVSIYLRLCSGDAAKVSFQYVMLDEFGMTWEGQERSKEMQFLIVVTGCGVLSTLAPKYYCNHQICLMTMARWRSRSCSPLFRKIPV
jgi:hypothetical protein